MPKKTVSHNFPGGVGDTRVTLRTAKTVGEVMTSPAITVTADTPILLALSMMTKRRIRHLPVVENDRLTGFVSIGDLVKHRIEKIEAEAAAMRDYISMA